MNNFWKTYFTAWAYLKAETFQQYSPVYESHFYAKNQAYKSVAGHILAFVVAQNLTSIEKFCLIFWTFASAD